MIEQVKEKFESLLVTEPTFLTRFCQKQYATDLELFKDKPDIIYSIMSLVRDIVEDKIDWKQTKE